MSKKKFVLVVNMHSRGSQKALKNLKDIFNSKKVDIDIIEVKDPKKLNQAFKKALDSKAEVIVLGGGDGTLISGIEYLTLNGYDKPIGLLPLGTANYLIRNLRMPLDLNQSVEILLRGNYKVIPVGEANGKFFALTLIIGMTQRVANDVSDKLKKKYGQLAYILELIKQTKNHEAFRYTIESPSLKKPIKGTTHQLIVYNSDLNLQLKLVPDHEITKDTLKVVISKGGRSKLKLYAGFMAHIGSLGKLRPYLRVLELRSLKIRTEPVLPADYDGETYDKSPYDVKIYEKKIKLIC